MSQRRNKQATAVALAAFLACTGFTHDGVRKATPCPYTASVVTAADQSGQGAHASDKDDARGFVPDLRLTEHAWKAATLFGRILTLDFGFTAGVQDTVVRVSGAVWNKSVDFLAAVARQATGRTEIDAIAIGPKLTPVEAATVAQVPVGNSPARPRSVVMDGRMPSLARTMSSPLDASMGLDDIARGEDAGVQVGFRLERSFAAPKDEAPIRLRLLVPGLNVE